MMETESTPSWPSSARTRRTSEAAGSRLVWKGTTRRQSATAATGAARPSARLAERGELARALERVGVRVEPEGDERVGLRDHGAAQVRAREHVALDVVDALGGHCAVQAEQADVDR